MLNKGPFMRDVLALLRDVLGRMSEHERKKMHLLRRLRVSDPVETDGHGAAAPTAAAAAAAANN